MTRLSIFDFDTAETPFCTVSELTARVKSTLERGFSDIALRGEISNLSLPRSGHIYLTLKDDSAQIRAVIWKGEADRIPFELQNGQQIKAWGKVTVYAPRGDYQIILRKVEPEGIGALELAFRQLHARLAAEGLFDEERKRPLPRFPKRIVVVTSPSGAAVRDFLQVTGRRWPGCEILIAPAKVQGIGSADEVVAAIEMANRVNGADLIVVCRGGGSLEDLWTFNEEIVARAIVASRLPVVSAIGHEVDITISDLVADFRASTPTAAGELCVPDSQEVAQRLDQLGERAGRALRTRVELAKIRLESLGERATRALRSRVDRLRLRLENLSERSARAVRKTLDDRKYRLGRLAAGLEALSPLGVLSRGYSLTFREDGDTLLRDAAEVKPGDVIVTRLNVGKVVSRVFDEADTLARPVKPIGEK